MVSLQLPNTSPPSCAKFAELLFLGPIIRISPYELHISDPTFFNQLYRQTGVWDKYAWSWDAFSAPGCVFTTADHAAHRARRTPLNSFYSRAEVASRQEIIQTTVDKLCSRVAESASTNKTIDIGAALSAFTRDVSLQYTIGTNYRNLDKDDFDYGMTVMQQGGGVVWRLTKHIPWYGPLMMSIPKSFLIKHADANTATFMQYLVVCLLGDQSLH